ncbi:hypothetical protein V1290_003187 [Bradyrhizobium sp. AZCC 1578]|uniref:hypothetical protein n=1 Tax=unclassified Bradyrhizobium TaxID=2631580 RepID=UPI002FEF5958
MSADIPSLAMLRFWGLRTVATASLRLSGRRGQIHALPPMGSAAHFTLIARMPAVADTQVGQILAELQRVSPSHHYYPADTVHVTIRNLDEAAREECDRPSLFRRIRGLVADSGSFALKGKGLGVSPNSVFLQLYPEDQGLADLRRKLSIATSDGDHRRREGLGILDDLARRYLFDKMAFATLIRFSGPVTPAFLAEIARHRETDFGTFPIDAFEIVRTDKFLSSTGTEIIARIVVGPD